VLGAPASSRLVGAAHAWTIRVFRGTSYPGRLEAGSPSTIVVVPIFAEVWPNDIVWSEGDLLEISVACSSDATGWRWRPVKTRRFKGLRGTRPRRLASEGAVVYPEWAMDSNSPRIDSVSGEGGPATRAEGDMRQDHVAYSRRDPPAAAPKSRAGGRLRSVREPGPGVIGGTAVPDITPAGERSARPGAIYGPPSPCLLADPRPRRRANLLIAGHFRPKRAAWTADDIRHECAGYHLGRPETTAFICGSCQTFGGLGT